MVRPEHVIYPQFGWLNDAIGGGGDIIGNRRVQLD